LGDGVAAFGAVNGFFLVEEVPVFSTTTLVVLLRRLPGVAVLLTAPPLVALAFDALGALAARSRCAGKTLSVLRREASLAAALAAVIVALAPELARRAGKLCLPFVEETADEDRLLPRALPTPDPELLLPKACAAELLVAGMPAMELVPAEPRRTASKAPWSAASRTELPPDRFLSRPRAPLAVGGAVLAATAAAAAA